MKKNLKRFLTSFVLVVIFYLISNNVLFLIFGFFYPHVGMLFVVGLLFGPYGAVGAMIANLLMDFFMGYTPIQILPSAIASLGVSYLAYKVWYSGFRKHKVFGPILDNNYHIMLFLADILLCGFMYSVIHVGLVSLFTEGNLYAEFLALEYFINFINIAFIFGVIACWLSKKIDFVSIPKKSKRQVKNKLYSVLFALMLISTLPIIIFVFLQNYTGVIVGIVITVVLLFAYLTKPFEFDVTFTEYTSITEKIITIFLLTTLIISVSAILISFYVGDLIGVIDVKVIHNYIPVMPLLIITDFIILLFFIPGLFINQYIEKKAIRPISSFSQIEGFIHENQKIEADKLIKIYLDYINQDDEIGMLARSYTNLINHSNNYIENIQKIEGEKERIKAELDIATKIQAANLPTEAIVDDEYIVNGFSHPAKEVGGDFFDYYPLDDDNLAIVIGDASGKGVPAALLAIITQVMIKQLLKQEGLNPSGVLSSFNNQLSENNPETMFITLWLGIYNKTTHKLKFSNAGHNPPLINENGEFRYLNIESGIVLGIMGDFEFVNEEITLSEELVLYTDGMTDAISEDNEMYGESRLLNFFNAFKSDDDPIRPLLNDIHNFTKGAEQFDDMTLLYLRLK